METFPVGDGEERRRGEERGRGGWDMREEGGGGWGRRKKGEDGGRIVTSFVSLHLVTSLRKLPAGQRPKSCTAPEIHLLPPDHTHQQSADVGVVKTGRKRSYSAVLPRYVSDEALTQLLYISRHTGLSHQNGACPQDTLDVEIQHITRRAEFMKIEMKGLRKNFHKERSKSRSSQRRKVHAEGEGPSSEQPPTVGKLPKIPDPSDAMKDAEGMGTRLSITVTKTSRSQHKRSHEHGKARGRPSPPNSSDTNTTAPFSPTASSTTGGQGSKASYASIVSVGENKRAELRASSHRTSRYSSGRSQGRLSQGWSPPQPIEPLKGSPIRSKVGGVERSEVRDETSPTASMVIDVNVMELIQNGD